METNELIEASAGTGKTQALAERLIALMKAGVKPGEIVALTFSRAAAGEIFERFVSLLAERGEADRLRRVIASQHLSQIGTLDSFLMRIVRAFPLELGLAGDLELLDEYHEGSYAGSVSFSILRRTDARTRKSFVEAFSLAMDHQDVRSFTEAYRRFIRDWHEKVAAMPSASSWGDPAAIWGGRKAFAEVTAAELAAAADALVGVEDSDEWRLFIEWVRGFRGSFAGVKGYAKKLLDAEDGVFDGATVEFDFGRGRNRRRVYVGEAAAKLRNALWCVYGYVIRRKLELARGVHTLISAFEKEYDLKVRRTGKLVFSDVPRLIAALPEEKRLALEYRMDARLGAWALDEFQDTSREQWKALGNLVGEALMSAGEKSVFIVGDRKQAIYGWRNGDVGIFSRERDSGAYHLGTLNRTYRSGPAVIEAVNRVFTTGALREDFPAWECPEHVSARPELGGFVQTAEASEGRMEAFAEPVFNALAAVDPVGKGLAAAVLVRSNRFGEYLADELRRRGLRDVVWEGESDVLATPALSGFLDLLQLADHPGDMLTYRHFLLTPLAGVCGCGDRGAPADGPEGAQELSRRFAQEFTVKGIVRVFRELRARLPLSPEAAWSRFTEECYNDMLVAAAEFELGYEASTRLGDFRAYLAAKRRRSIAEAGRIRIMTIHRSKGLGFDYVVLPLYERDGLTVEPDGPLIGEGPGGDWILPDPGARVTKAVGGLEAAWRLRKDRAEQEALCTYYVAMTRAKRAMTIVLHPEPAKATSVRFSGYVRRALGGGAEIGDRGWASACRAEAAAAPVERPAVPPPARGPRVKLRRRLPSLGFSSGQSAGLLFAPRRFRKAAMERGTRVHAEFELVEFLEPGERPDLPEEVREALRRPEGFVELWRERAFEVCADGEWMSGRFDRVVFFERDGLLRAEVQDFKTGRGADADYEPQLRAYRRAVSTLTGLSPDRVASRVLRVDPQAG